MHMYFFFLKLKQFEQWININTGFQIQYACYITTKSFLKLKSSQKELKPDKN